MIILASTTEVLRARLAAAPASVEPTFSSAWGDSSSTPILGNTRGALNGTTNVSLVGSPAASTQRVIKGVYIYNGDTASVDVTIEHFDGTNAYAIAVVTLISGYTLSLDDAGLRVTSDAGEILTGSGGTVSSVAMTVPPDFAVSGSPITTAGTLAVTETTQSANKVKAGPSSGGAAVPTYRALVAADIPTLNQSTTGNAATATELQTARTIAGVSFDGTANIDIPFSGLTGTSGVTQTIGSGTASLGTSAIASGAKATVVTVSASGVATTDVIDWGFNGDPTAVTGYVPSANGMLTIIAYPTANNVNFVVTNNTGASITPGAVTLNWRVLR